MADVISALESSVLSAYELRELTNWPDQVIEDYLNIIRNLALIANGVNGLELDVGDVPTLEEFNELAAEVGQNTAKIDALIAVLADVKESIEALGIGRLITRSSILEAKSMDLEQLAYAW